MADTDPAPTPDPKPKNTKQAEVVLATENHLTVFVDGDIRVDHLGVSLPKDRADELERKAAQHPYGVRLVDITPNEKD